MTLGSWRNTAPTIHLLELQYDRQNNSLYLCSLGPKLRYRLTILSWKCLGVTSLPCPSPGDGGGGGVGGLAVIPQSLPPKRTQSQSHPTVLEPPAHLSTPLPPLPQAPSSLGPGLALACSGTQEVLNTQLIDKRITSKPSSDPAGNKEGKLLARGRLTANGRPRTKSCDPVLPSPSHVASRSTNAATT